jgi:hypothetical protein
MDRAFVYIVAVGWLSAEAYSLAVGMIIGALVISLGFIVEELTES